ncbi:MAG: TonB-dependent receptor [Halioglobus sp.]
MKAMHRNRISALVTAALVAPAAIGSGNRLEEVIVTAQKRDQNVLEVPIAMNVIGRDVVDNEFLNSLEDITRLAPSLTIVSDDIRVRGVGTGGFALQVEPTVAVAIDGVVLSRTSQAFIDLIDVERIEVLRGPQGTLFGKNASAGLVQVVTRAPSQEFTAEAEVQVTGTEAYIAKGAASGGLSDNTRASLSGYYEDDEGFSGSVAVGGKRNGVETYALRGKLESDLSDRLNMLLTAYVREEDKTGPDLQWLSISDPGLAFVIERAGVTPSEDNDVATSDGKGFEDTDDWGTTAEFNFSTEGGYTLTSLTAYLDWKRDSRDDVDEQPLGIRETIFFSDVPSPFGTVGPVNFQQSGTTTIDQWSQEFRLTSPDNGQYNYILGLYGQRFELDDTLRRDFDFCTLPGLLLGFTPGPVSPSLTPGDACVDPTFSVASVSTLSDFVGFPQIDGLPAATISEIERYVESESYAVFGQGTYHLTDKLDITGGLRWQYDKTDFGFNVSIPSIVPGFGFGDAVALDGDVDNDGMSGKLALQYQVNDETMVYASYARGYKGPTGVFEGAETEEIDPETSNNYEIGMKASLLDGKGFIALTGFWSEYDNFQEEQFSQVERTFILSNVGEVRTRGVELESRFGIGDYTTLSAAAAWVDAEIRDFPGGPCFTPAVEDPGCTFNTLPDGGQSTTKDLSGGELPNSPEFKLYTSARYERGIGSSEWQGFGQISYSWQDDVQFSLNQNPRTVQDAYGIVDASVGFGRQDGGLQFSLFVKNLLDENYASVLFQDFIINYSPNIIKAGPREAERTFGGAIRWKY